MSGSETTTYHVMLAVTTPAGTEIDDVKTELYDALHGVGENEPTWKFGLTVAP